MKKKYIFMGKWAVFLCLFLNSICIHASMLDVLSTSEKEVRIYVKKMLEVFDEKFEELKNKLEPTESIQITSVGDIMMHEPQIRGGYNSQTGSYDYNYMFDEVSPYLKEGDLTIGNLELTMAGIDKGYSGYPQFNSPYELADALKNSGFDLLTTANNHSLDRRFYGVQKTIEALDQRGLKHTGTYKSEAESKKILIQKVKNTNIAFLAYTYGTNGINPDSGKAFCVNIINKEKMAQDIQMAKAQGAELICVSIHFGNEYIRKPNAYEQEAVNFLVDNGVDIILGGHPHVLQPMEIRKTYHEGKEKEVVIIYSQGNFISAQRDRYKDAGAIFSIQLDKHMDTGKITVRQISYIPTWVDQSRVNKKPHYRVLAAKRSILLYETRQDSLISAKDYTNLKRTLQDVRQTYESEDNRIIEQETYIN